MRKITEIHLFFKKKQKTITNTSIHLVGVCRLFTLSSLQAMTKSYLTLPLWLRVCVCVCEQG